MPARGHELDFLEPGCSRGGRVRCMMRPGASCGREPSPLLLRSRLTTIGDQPRTSTMCDIIFVKDNDPDASDTQQVSIAVRVGFDNPEYPLLATIRYGLPGEPVQEWGYVGQYCDRASRKLKLIIDAENNLSCVHNGTLVPLCQQQSPPSS
jgi:hypothetical protein